MQCRHTSSVYLSNMNENVLHPRTIQSNDNTIHYTDNKSEAV